MRRIGTQTILVLLVVANLAPLGYMLLLALSWQGAPGLQAWRELWLGAPYLSRWLGNSLAVAGLTVGFHLLADSMAGFVLAKRVFYGQRLVLAVVLLALMVPRQVTLIPLFLGMARLNLADTFAGLLLPGLGDVIGIFLMRQFFIALPGALLEAARMDGASEWGAFRHVALPLARPALAVLGVLAFQHYWSDFFWPLVITQSPEHFTIQVGLAYLSQSEFGPQLELMAAGALMAAMPILILFLCVRRHYFAGLRAGALK